MSALVQLGALRARAQRMHVDWPAHMPNEQSRLEERNRRMRALELDSNNTVKLVSLALVLDPDEHVELPPGSTWTKRGLYLKALELDPSWALAYHNLAASMHPRDTLQLPNSMTVTRLDLFVKSLELDPKSTDAYTNLGAALEPGEVVTLAEDTKCRAQELFIRALDLDPQNARALALLGASLNRGETLQLSSGGPKHTAQDLLFEALRLDSTLAQAYHALGLSWMEEGTARFLLPDGRYWDHRELLVRAIELDPGSAPAFRDLASMLVEPPDCVQLADGSVLTRRDLLVKAAALERWERKGCDRLTRERWQPVTGLHEQRWRPGTQEMMPDVPGPLAVRRFNPPRQAPAP